MPWPIPASPVGVRRGLGSVLALGALGAGALLATMPTSATAAPDPCAASQIAKTVGAVANNTGSYLDAHPQTNQALTTISQQQAGPRPWSRSRATSTPIRRPPRICRPSSNR